MATESLGFTGDEYSEELGRGVCVWVTSSGLLLESAGSGIPVVVQCSYLAAKFKCKEIALARINLNPRVSSSESSGTH